MAEPTDEELNRHMDVYEEEEKENEVSMWDWLPPRNSGYTYSRALGRLHQHKRNFQFRTLVTGIVYPLKFKTASFPLQPGNRFMIVERTKPCMIFLKKL